MLRYKSIGVTATKNGLTIAQKQWMSAFLKDNAANVLHHGDCIGGDAQLAAMFSSEGSYIIAHPGNSADSLKAHSKFNNLILPWSENLVRNRYIVNHSELVLAFPATGFEIARSGTWSTIRYAKRQKAPLRVIHPDGYSIKEVVLDAVREVKNET